MRSERIPVLLLTGALGSGKTTLLASWLRQPALRDAALVVNEAGEVALDDRLLRPLMQAGEGAALLANTCICCAGLPGLEEALADLYRARLERRIPRFDQVVIETTGLAEPQPIRAAFATDAGLRERYRLAGVVTAVSATAPRALAGRAEWQAQVAGADLLVLTKADRADATALEELEHDLRVRNPRAAAVRSAQASLSAQEMLRLLPASTDDSSAVARAASSGNADRHAHAHHHHAAEAVFVELAQPLRRAAIAQRLQRCIAAAPAELLRIKGTLRADDGLAFTVQWSPGDACAALAPFSGELPACGLTVIATTAAAAAAAARVLGAER